MIKALIFAFQYLTRIPIGKNIEFTKENMANAKLFFPLVGGIIGFLTGLSIKLILPFGFQIAAISGLLVNVILTGAFHLDGLGDMCDGFFSNLERDRVLEIMKDPRAGNFAVISLVLFLLAKFTFYSVLGLNSILILTVSGIYSRIAVLYAIELKSNSRKDGLGDFVKQSKTGNLMIVSMIIYIFFSTIFMPKLLAALIMAILTSEIISRISCRKIGGLTGDVYGAIVEISELVSIITIVVII
ncbi:MAG: adenosylcobinamide-GDP ribazoletransferase [Tissierellia bacterium]|nr:adenosylcobinamide-GDP ribazoletransferase [Tissierellia bacterium]